MIWGGLPEEHLAQARWASEAFKEAEATQAAAALEAVKMTTTSTHDLEALRRDRAEAASRMQALADASRGRSMTDDEQHDFDKASAKVSRCDDIAAAEGATNAAPAQQRSTPVAYTGTGHSDSDFEAGLAAHRAKRRAEEADGRDLAKASMAKLIASGAAGSSAADTSSGAGLARANMARQLKKAG